MLIKRSNSRHSDDLFSVFSLVIRENELTRRTPISPPYIVMLTGEEVMAHVPVVQPIKYQ